MYRVYWTTYDEDGHPTPHAEDFPSDQLAAVLARCEALRNGARDLVKRSAEMAQCLLEREIAHPSIERGGRKASA